MRFPKTLNFEDLNPEAKIISHYNKLKGAPLWLLLKISEFFLGAFIFK